MQIPPFIKSLGLPSSINMIGMHKKMKAKMMYKIPIEVIKTIFKKFIIHIIQSKKI